MKFNLRTRISAKFSVQKVLIFLIVFELFLIPISSLFGINKVHADTSLNIASYLSTGDFDANSILVEFEDGTVDQIIISSEEKPILADEKTDKELVKRMVAAALNTPSIKSAQPNYLYTSDAWIVKEGFKVPTNYSFVNHWYYTKSKLPEMWRDQGCPESAGCGGSPDVTVAVIDSGLAFENFSDTGGLTRTQYAQIPAFSDFNLFVNDGEIANNGKDDDCNGYVDDVNGIDAYAKTQLTSGTCSGNTPLTMANNYKKAGHPVDTYGHGTYVTGLIASNIDTIQAPTVSPAFNVTIMPISANIHFEQFFTTQSVIHAIEYAVDNGADIINMSLTTTFPDPMIKFEVDAANNAGVLVVAAAGNLNSTELGYPAGFDSVFSVGAINTNNTKAAYSNYGDSIDVVAYVGDGSGSTEYATYQSTLSCFGTCSSQTIASGFKNFFLIGTSFAAPQVSAYAALLKSRNPSLMAADLKQVIRDSVTDIAPTGKDDDTGHGVIDFSTITGVSVSGTSNAVHRFFSPVLGAHFYTISEAEKNMVQNTLSAFWTYEGIAFRAQTDNGGGSKAVYRFWSDTFKTHFYTISEQEKSNVAANFDDSIWRFEGVAYYAYQNAPSLTPVFRFWSPQNARHFYTTSVTERDQLIATFDESVWTYEGIAYYSFPQ